jgi:hypothetical protein
VRVSGIDLASQPENTATCVLEWTGSRRCVDLTTGANDADVIATALAGDKCGIDAPFGWPDAFVAIVAGHHSGETTTVPESNESLRLRATDKWVWRTYGRIPLSVSTDNIGVVALRCVGLQQQFAEASGATVDRTGAGRLAEVYPAAALKVWGLPHSGYKRGENASERRNFVLAAVLDRFGIVLSAEQHATAASSHDALDALISAVIAGLAADGHTTPPPPHLRGAARREGWIHLPPAS